MVRYQKREFSIRNKQTEDDGKRIHFQRVHSNPKKLVARPMWWLFVLLFVVILIMRYLNGIR